MLDSVEVFKFKAHSPSHVSCICRQRKKAKKVKESSNVHT
jgi:hypothetical protein